MLKIFRLCTVIIVSLLIVACAKKDIKLVDENSKIVVLELDGTSKGVKINDKFNESVLEKYTEEIDGCFLAKEINNGNNGLNYEINEKIVSRIIASRKDMLSPYGVAVGDSANKVYINHPKNIEPDIEIDENGKEGDMFIYYKINPNKEVGVRYDISSNIVTSISVGNLFSCI